MVILQTLQTGWITSPPIESIAESKCKTISPSVLKQVIKQVISRLGMQYDDQNITAIVWMALQALWRSKRCHTVWHALGTAWVDQLY